MGIFKKANNKLEGAVEGAFGRAFKSSVQPVELAHKLAKEMGDHKTVGVSNVYVPNEFDVYLGKDDYDHLASFEDSLKQELSNYVTAFARREGWTLVAPPSIELHKDDDLRVGEFGIATRTVSAPVEAPDSPFDAPPASVVPPAAAAAPGGMLDQTVLYQEPAAAAAPAAAPRRSSARGVLRGRQGDYQLSEPITVIGRSRRCDIVLTDANVSRQHAEIRRQGDGFMLVDLGSTNGTRVNRRDVKQVVLQHGDRIELGTTELLFERQP
ncbi:MAG TPA: DUF3662 and FHA domain-containing protein [Thermoleophilia bacterium]|nr:DUF3662 and FHA domain-containing protein [Thermoleophilia bacterium]